MGSVGRLAPHVLLVSLPAQGHVNPLLRLAKRLAAKGLLVTFSSTKNIGARIMSSTKSEAESLIPMGKGHLCFEFFRDGWEDIFDPRRLNPLAEFPVKTSNAHGTVKLPGVAELKQDELPTFLLESSPCVELKEVILSQFRNVEKAAWVFANTFEELESSAINALSEKVPLIAVGPLADGAESQHVKGDMFKAENCMGWLNAQEVASVVYASLGSIVDLWEEEMSEMAKGLMNCRQPFLWMVRESSRSLLPDGFMEEAQGCGRGKLVSWSPQEQV